MLKFKKHSMHKKDTAIEMYQAGLTRLIAPHHPTVRSAAIAKTAVTDFIFEFSTKDRTFSTDQYPASGVFGATTTPWLNDINTVPAEYQWTKQDVDFQKTRSTQVNSENAYIQANVKNQTYTGTAIEQLKQRFVKGMWDTSVFNQDQIDTLTDNWIGDDLEFARQRLGGSNPNVMAKYAGTNDDLNLLINNSTGTLDATGLIAKLSDANSKGQLFVCDYTNVLASVEKNGFVQSNSKPDYMPNGFNLSTPIAFYAVVSNAGKDVMTPVAIQVDAVNNGYVYTPDDSENAWMLAKLWVASADAQWWFSGTHLYNTHSIDMIFGIAALNLLEQGKLDENHPMIILMKPHFSKVFNINSAVYDPVSNNGIYQVGSFCDDFLPTGRIGLYQIINNLYQDYNFDDNSFVNTMKSRNIEKADFAGDFPYRDDSQIWWNSITTFVSGIVDATYGSDADVQADTQLNEWMKYTQDAFNNDGVTRFTWTPTKAYLKEVFTNLFFVTTAQHTAVNDSMFNGWAFVPNGAFAMASPPPTSGSVSDEDLLNALPNPQTISTVGGDEYYAWLIQNQIDFVMNGTAEVDDLVAGDGSESALHNMYPYGNTSKQYEAVTAFFNDLWTGDNSIYNQITANQKGRVDAYNAANPNATTVPNSVYYEYLSVKLGAASDLNAPVMNCIQI